MASKRKADEILSWFEWGFTYYDSYKFRRLSTWSPLANDVVEAAPVPHDLVNNIMAEPIQNMQENNNQLNNNDMLMD